MTEVSTVRKTVTVVFTDVAGSTAMGERLDPETVRQIMGRYFAAMREVIERHGGTVEKFIGDAMMAIFGIPQVHEDDALRAVRAAAEMHSVLASLNDQLQAEWGTTIAIRTGVNTGEVVAGEAMPGAPMVTGDAVNVAARLEQNAASGEILLGATTYRLVRDAVTVDVMEPLALKGKAESTAVFRLVRVLSGEETLARRLDSPMVGRDEQLELLLHSFEAAVTGRACHQFTILGTAGVGKSRLLEEFTTSVAGRATVLRGRCLSYGQGITLWPVAEVVRGAAHLQDFDPPETVERRLTDLVGGDEHAGAIAGRLMQVVGASGGLAPPEEAQWAVRRLLEILGSQSPLIVVFDDLHWAEPTLVDLIDEVTETASDAAILVICTARPEFLETRADWATTKVNATTIALEPLSDADSESLIANLLGATDLDPNIQARIVQAAGGNPLFVEQMLSMLIDDGLITKVDGRWLATADHLEVAVPPTISALLSARLDLLPVDERNVIGRAAVIGQVFYPGAVVDLGPDEAGAAIGDLMGSLVGKDLIWPDRSTLPGHEAFRFRHILVQESAYAALPKERRATLHQRFAAWLEQTAGDRIEEQEEILGYHLERAYRYREQLGVVTDAHRAIAAQAATRLGSAGLRALNRFDYSATINLLTRASNLLPADSPMRLELLSDLATAHAQQGERADEGERLWAEAADGARAIGDDRVLAHALVQRWRGTGSIDVVGDRDAAARDAEWAADVFEAAQDARGLARAWRLRGQVGVWNGRFAVDEAAVAQAIPLARQAGDAFDEYDAYLALSAAVVRGATPVEHGIRRCEQIVAENMNQRSIESCMWHALAHLTARTGAFERAREYAARMREHLLDTGQRQDFDFFVEVLGDVEMVAGEPAAAERILREGYDALASRGRPDPLLAAFLARAICAQGKFAEAEPYAELAANSTTMRISAPLGKGALARVRARQDRLADAENLAREAVALLADTDFLIDRADTLTDLADVLVLAGRSDDARDALIQALALYEQKGDVVTPVRIRATLAQL